MGILGRRRASGWRNHPEARDLRLRVQVHRRAWPTSDSRRISRRRRRRGFRRKARKAFARAQAPRVCSHRFPDGAATARSIVSRRTRSRDDATRVSFHRRQQRRGSRSRSCASASCASRSMRTRFGARAESVVNSYRRSDRGAGWCSRRPSGARRVARPSPTLRAIRRRGGDRDDVHCGRAGGEIRRAISRSSFHSISITGAIPCRTSIILCIAFDHAWQALSGLPVMLDFDGQRPEEIEH